MEESAINIESFNFCQENRTIALSGVIEQLRKDGLLPNRLEGLKALDLGTGFGSGVIALKNSSVKVQGIEASQVTVEKVIKRGILGPNEIKQGNVPPILEEFGEEEFDLITAFGATLPIESMLHKSARILRKGGRIIITTHYGNLTELERLNMQMNNPEATLNKLGYRGHGIRRVDIGIYDDPYCLVVEKIK